MIKFWLHPASPASVSSSGPLAQDRNRRAAALTVLIAFLGVFSIASLSILAARGSNPVASVWPVNALVLVAILRSPLHRTLRMDSGLAAFAGSVLANWLGGSSPAAAIGFTVANGVEIAIAFLFVRGIALTSAKSGETATILEQFKHLTRAGLLAPIAGATIASACLLAEGQGPIGNAWLDWYFAAALGMMIVAPLGVRLSAYDLPRLRALKGADSGLACALLVIAVSAFVFWQNQWPLLFLVTPTILRAANKHRSLGAAASIVLVAAIAIPLTAMGRGPMALIQDADPYQKQFLLEFFLLVHVLMALRVAAMMDDRDGLQRILESREIAARQKAAARARLLDFTAHEIRTPLNVISGLAEVLRSNNRLSVEDSKLVATMVGASAQLQTLANDLLDRSRIEEGALRLQPERVSVSSLLSETLEDVKAGPDFADANLIVEAPPGLMIWADPFRARQIFRNLIVNSIKYAGSYGPIRVLARAEGDDFCVIEVIDHGPGIAPIRHKHVFEAFSPAGPDSASRSGAGLGLSMVKLLAEMQGGSVGFSSAPHIETRFWVKLPTSKPAQPHGLALDAPDFDPSLVFPH
ncbi:MAG: ATP-binding protein [Caulobacterales bacterium]